MTVIAYDPVANAIYVDSGITWYDGRRTTKFSKIEKHGDWRYTLSGSGSDLNLNELAVKAVLSHVEHVSVEGFGDDLDIAGIARNTKTNEVWIITGQNKRVFSSTWAYNLPFISGSGGIWLAAYLALGQSVEEAMHNVARLHAQCDLPVEQF